MFDQVGPPAPNISLSIGGEPGLLLKCGRVTLNSLIFYESRDSHVSFIGGTVPLPGPLHLTQASRQNSASFEVGEVADWSTLVDSVPITFDGHGGSNAPHLFKFCRRHGPTNESHLNKLAMVLDLWLVRGRPDLWLSRSVARPLWYDSFAGPRREDLCLELDDTNMKEDFADGEARRAGDVFLLTRHYMASAKVSQAIAVLPETRAFKGVQPRGVRPRIRVRWNGGHMS
jgi:hypothetical protein